MAATMTQKEVAEYLGVSVRTLATMEENGVIKRLPSLPEARYSTSKIKELAGEGQKTYGQMKAEGQNLLVRTPEVGRHSPDYRKRGIAWLNLSNRCSKKLTTSTTCCRAELISAWSMTTHEDAGMAT
jgi:hypothetical protein